MARGDAGRDQCPILLREKDETVRWQPVSTLMARLVLHGGQGDTRELSHAGSYEATTWVLLGRAVDLRRFACERGSW